jgi:hypothetical protein
MGKKFDKFWSEWICATYTPLKYGQRVEFKEGFYKGQRGKVIGEPQWYSKGFYSIILDDGTFVEGTAAPRLEVINA